MTTVTLYGDHLAGGKPEYPGYCVVCGNECEDYFLMPVATNGGSAILHDLFKSGELHRVPVHAGACRTELKRDFFARRQLPLLLTGAYVALLIPVAQFFGVEYFLAGIIGILPVAVIQAWHHHKKPVLFEARVEMDNWGRGLLTVEAENESFANRFAERNARALYSSPKAV